MIGFVFRRILAAAPVLLALSMVLFVVIAAAPPPVGLSEEEEARRFLNLPLLFNVAPEDRPRIVADMVNRLAREEGPERAHEIAKLLQIGAAGLVDLVPALDHVPLEARAEIARDLAPLAFRMGLEDVSDLDVPARAERFWRRVLEDRGADLRPATVRRALRRHLTDRSEPLYARELSSADTAALQPLLDALEGQLDVGDREEVETLAIAAAIKAGATDVEDVPSLQAWWSVHRSEYVEFDPVERLVGHITETRFGRWMASAFVQRLGRSWRTDAPVLDDIAQKAPPTLLRTALAILLAHFIALPLGALAAAQRGRPIDRVAAGVSFLFYAVPSFVLVFLGRAALPRAGDALTVIALALAAVAPISRHTRVAVLEVIHQDYVRVARAKGVPEISIWFRHVLRNAIGPVLALSSVQAPLVLGASLVAEEILRLDGLGPATMAAIRAHDMPWLMALAFLVGIFTLTLFVLADIVHAAIDPRVRNALATGYGDA